VATKIALSGSIQHANGIRPHPMKAVLFTPQALYVATPRQNSTVEFDFMEFQMENAGIRRVWCGMCFLVLPNSYGSFIINLRSCRSCCMWRQKPVHPVCSRRAPISVLFSFVWKERLDSSAHCKYGYAVGHDKKISTSLKLESQHSVVRIYFRECMIFN